jgi:chromosome segregation ATPase
MYFSLFLLAGAQETQEGTTSIEDSVEISPSGQNPIPRQMQNEVRTNIEERKAERASTTEERQESRASSTEARQEKRVQAQENRVELREERQAVLQEVRQKRVINLSANISNRMESAIERLTNITTRLDARMNKMNELGMDTNEAKAKLTEVRASLASARATLGNIDNLVFSATTSEKPVSDWKKLREIYLEAGRQIRQAQLQLREVITLLKQPVRIETAASATTTATTSAEGL